MCNSDADFVSKIKTCILSRSICKLRNNSSNFELHHPNLIFILPLHLFNRASNVIFILRISKANLGGGRGLSLPIIN